MKIDCSSIQASLYAFVNNELSSAENRKVRHHLDICPTCNSIYCQYSEVFDQLDSWGEITPSSDLHRLLRERVVLKRSYLVRKKLSQLGFLRHYITLRRSIIGLAVMVMIGVSIYKFVKFHEQNGLDFHQPEINVAVVDTNKKHTPTLLDSILSFSSAPAKQTRVNTTSWQTNLP
ncbi:zf-HC2 domain-containing protein [candidate division KSB1 bacterium]|nr:zf-HC2 domain-containing protein [candidate division KSB1 bacterium]